MHTYTRHRNDNATTFTCKCVLNFRNDSPQRFSLQSFPQTASFVLSSRGAAITLIEQHRCFWTGEEARASLIHIDLWCTFPDLTCVKCNFIIVNLLHQTLKNSYYVDHMRALLILLKYKFLVCVACSFKIKLTDNIQVILQSLHINIKLIFDCYEKKRKRSLQITTPRPDEVSIEMQIFWQVFRDGSDDFPMASNHRRRFLDRRT